MPCREHFKKRTARTHSFCCCHAAIPTIQTTLFTACLVRFSLCSYVHYLACSQLPHAWAVSSTKTTMKSIFCGLVALGAAVGLVCFLRFHHDSDSARGGSVLVHDDPTQGLTEIIDLAEASPQCGMTDLPDGHWTDASTSCGPAAVHCRVDGRCLVLEFPLQEYWVPLTVVVHVGRVHGSLDVEVSVSKEEFFFSYGPCWWCALTAMKFHWRPYTNSALIQMNVPCGRFSLPPTYRKTPFGRWTGKASTWASCPT